MAARRQVELQLGHMCNNRCVFCVSGQETALGRAGPAPAAPAIEQLRAARAAGAEKVTLLGGEPTLQPEFLEVVAAAAALGFDEIEVFTNGVRTAREAYLDQVIQAGQGRVIWRLSFQGATAEAHERTTQKPGSFARLLATLDHLHQRGQAATVNLCLVRSNADSVAAFPQLLLPRGVRQLHLDMMRPLDAGRRGDDELDRTLPRYADLAAPLGAMARGFPEGFDLNIGNLPHCVAPELFPWIHHDGQPTDMVAVDGQQRFSRPLDKYLTKRRDKVHPEGCERCAFAGRCSGVFETYLRLRGAGEFAPVDEATLDRVDPDRRLLAPRLRLRLRPWSPPAPFALRLEERGDGELLVHLAAPGLALSVALRAPGAGAASTAEVSLHVAAARGDRGALAGALGSLWGHLSDGAAVLHPPGDDALAPAAPTVAARVRRLRAAAPFGRLGWQGLRLSEGGARAEVALRGPGGEGAVLWLAERQGKASGGYQVEPGEPSPALVEGLQAAIAALRGRG